MFCVVGHCSPKLEYRFDSALQSATFYCRKYRLHCCLLGDRKSDGMESLVHIFTLSLTMTAIGVNRFLSPTNSKYSKSSKSSLSIFCICGHFEGFTIQHLLCNVNWFAWKCEYSEWQDILSPIIAMGTDNIAEWVTMTQSLSSSPISVILQSNYKLIYPFRFTIHDPPHLRAKNDNSIWLPCWASSRGSIESGWLSLRFNSCLMHFAHQVSIWRCRTRNCNAHQFWATPTEPINFIRCIRSPVYEIMHSTVWMRKKTSWKLPAARIAKRAS